MILELLDQIRHLPGCKVVATPGACSCGLASLRRAVLGESAPCPNDLPLGKVRLYLHERLKEYTARGWQWNYQAIISAALERVILAEAEQQAREISINGFIDRVQSELAQRPEFADLVAEAGRLLDLRTRGVKS